MKYLIQLKVRSDCIRLLNARLYNLSIAVGLGGFTYPFPVLVTWELRMTTYLPKNEGDASQVWMPDPVLWKNFGYYC